MWHYLNDGYVLWDKNEFPKSEFDRRHSELASAAKRDGVDAILVYSDKSKPGDACYVTNYVGPYGNQRVVIVRPNGKITFIVDAAERDLPRVQAPSYVEDVRVSKNPVDEAARIIKSEPFKSKRIGLAGDLNRTAFVHESLQAKIPEAEVVFGSRYNDILWSLRLVKKKAEIEKIRRAVATVTDAYAKLAGSIKAGASETQITAEATRIMRLGEAEDTGVLVSSGKKVSLDPSPFPSERTLQEGDTILASLAMQYRHYWAALSRTLTVGRPSPEVSSLHEAAMRARDSVRHLIRPGVRARHLAIEASRIFVEKGVKSSGVYGSGIGIDLRERPVISIEDETPLMPGMVLNLSFAPRNSEGLTIALGDMVLVTGSGGELLTTPDAGLKSI